MENTVEHAFNKRMSKAEYELRSTEICDWAAAMYREGKATEAEIEARVERMFDRLDAQYLFGE